MTVAQLKVALCELDVEKSEHRCPKKHVLQAMLQYILQSIRTKTNQNMQHCMSSQPTEGDQQAKFTLLH